MEKLGFYQRWRNLMMQCVSSVTYSVRINSKPRGQIVPTRGLRQGDPLSPYIFLLCAEGLSALIKNAISEGIVEGCKPSYVWQSIMAAQDIVRRGMRWQSDAQVKELIDLRTREWKMELIQRIFLPQEADIIGGIALSSQLPNDKQIWAVTANERFNVKSAYKLVMELSSRSERACKEILPTKENLKRRKVLEDSGCDSYHTYEESTGHLSWSCCRAQEMWAISKLFPRNCAWPFLSYLDLLWFIVMVEQWDQDWVEKVVMVAWAIWQNRNEHRNRGKKKNISVVVHKAIDYLHEYQACCAKVEVHIPSLDANWTPPPPRHYKINVDEAVFGAQKAVGIGVLVRDAEGRMVRLFNINLNALSCKSSLGNIGYVGINA
ncbi:uncharacterized protein LOC142616354 [Castanea sativa]|uniref:uncharacterized protein LOC142616354 n=1 Tax=Castanea sativa TaxID=21020 RepID=UPI003F64CB34